MDVQNLYGNVPTDGAITAVCNMLQEHKDKIDLFGLTLDGLEILLRHCLQNNYLTLARSGHFSLRGRSGGLDDPPPLAIGP